MKTKHTPGRWSVMTNRTYNSHFQVDFCSFRIVNAKKEEAEANARLIAAAPELLEACKKALIELQGFKGCGHTEGMLLLERVIKKTEGK